MSIDISWESLTSGEDGESLAHTIRDFIHERFQQVTLPRFIQSVKVHAFDFGTVGPELELKDICDPLQDFYDEDEAEDGEDGIAQDADADMGYSSIPQRHEATHNEEAFISSDQIEGSPENLSKGAVQSERDPHESQRRSQLNIDVKATGPRSALASADSAGPLSATPRVPGGTSNMSYFHMPMGAGLSGAATPLAWSEHHQPMPWHLTSDGPNPSSRSASIASPIHQSVNLLTSTQFDNWRNSSRWNALGSIRESHRADSTYSISETPNERSTNDVQVVARVKYSGDVQLSLTAEILLDYPMPSFVGIPLELNVTGMTFDGVAILAYIKKKAHFCFLAPEDADTLIGGESTIEIAPADPLEGSPQPKKHRVGGLFEHIRVESQIGRKSDGKQVLKNVGKVENFVLEQVRKIFEDEFVYPSFWTFLV